MWLSFTLIIISYQWNLLFSSIKIHMFVYQNILDSFSSFCLLCPLDLIWQHGWSTEWYNKGSTWALFPPLPLCISFPLFPVIFALIFFTWLKRNEYKLPFSFTETDAYHNHDDDADDDKSHSYTNYYQSHICATTRNFNFKMQR